MARRQLHGRMLRRLFFLLLINYTGKCLGFGINTICPENCVCKSVDHGLDVDCSRQNFTSVPNKLSPNTSHLDLSMNVIPEVPEFAFVSVPHLEELRLVGNKLRRLKPNSFAGLNKLKILYLTGNQFTSVPGEAFSTLYSVEHLHLDTNRIEEVPVESFIRMKSLKHLWLNGNSLKNVPVKSLSHAHALEVLWLSVNQISTIPDYAFYNNTRLGALLLHDNVISEVGDHAFEGLEMLQVLEINRNRLPRVPVALYALPGLDDLTLADNDIEYLPGDSFAGNKKLVYLQLKGNPITSIGRKTFANLPHLEKLILSEARDQNLFPDLTGSESIKILGFDRASIESIPSNICTLLPKLQSFDIHSNRILDIPDLSQCSELRILNLGNNKLTSLVGEPFIGLSQLRDLTLSHNYITSIPETAFTGLDRLQYLDLLHNRIGSIHPQAFQSLDQLEDLNLGENSFSDLPTEGLSNLKHLKTHHNKELQDFPPPEVFPEIRFLVLSYAYHCCEFIESEDENPEEEIELSEDIQWLMNEEYDTSLLHNLTNILAPLDNLSLSQEDLGHVLYDGFGTDYEYEIPTVAEQYFEDYKPRYYAQDIIPNKPPIVCKPMPGPFMPCVDLFGYWLLRCGVWLVFLLAVLGNGVVLFVSVSSRSKMDVPRFLICNLASADFCMGIYLGFLAIVDASTLGEFKKHAIKWQTSPGCLIAGFLGVLSSELGVFTLTVITLERFYAITHAMQLNKRLSLKRAGYIMIGGWMFAILVASLPLFGISDYRKFAVCLPFETSDTASLGYVCFIMLFNGISFSVIISCYLKMYCSIRGSHAWNSNDTRVAKRMALLVFTDFACWAPITFFSLTAAFGKELISLDEAKIFTIFVLPLNSCANPFLYAILTKQFKKDCVKLCKRLEETAVSRRLTRISNRNISSWSSSRRPSGANSFFNVEKRESNTISGGLVNYNVDGNNSGPSRTGTTSSGAASGQSKGGNASHGSGSKGHTKGSSLRQCNVCMHVIKESNTTPAEEQMLEELHQNVLKIEENSQSEHEPNEMTSFDADIQSHGELNVTRVPPEIHSNASTSSKSVAACAESNEGDANDSLDSDREIPLLPLDSSALNDPGVQGAESASNVPENKDLGACAASDTEAPSDDIVTPGKRTEGYCHCQKRKKRPSVEFEKGSHPKSSPSEGPVQRQGSSGRSKSHGTVIFRQCQSCRKSTVFIADDSIQNVLTCDHPSLPYSKDLNIILEKQNVTKSKLASCDNYKHARKKLPLLRQSLLDSSKAASHSHSPCRKPSTRQIRKKSSRHDVRSNSWADLSRKQHTCSAVINPKRHSVTADYLFWTDDLEFRDSAFVEDESLEPDSDMSSSSQSGVTRCSKHPPHNLTSNELHHLESSSEKCCLHEKCCQGRHQSLRCRESKPLLQSKVDGVTLSGSFDRESGFSSDC